MKKTAKKRTSISVYCEMLPKVREVAEDMKRNQQSTIEIMLDFAYRMHKNGVKIFEF